MAGAGGLMDSEKLAKMIDHTLLKPEATAGEFEKLCQEATENGFYAVCVPPQWVKFVKERLKISDVKVASVVGFPHGNTLTSVKVYEAQSAIEAGADEIDMVIQIGKLQNGDAEAVKADIEGVVRASKTKKEKVLVKVILETGILKKSQKVLGCRLVAEAGADFVKTSTGFHSSGGATVSDVALLRETSPQAMGVKASGGIRDLRTALAMIGAGATRLGCSASVDILKELNEEKTNAVAEADSPSHKRLQFEYVWKYFAFHAAQRTSMFNYFLVIVAAFLTAYTWLVARSNPPLYFQAGIVALVGGVITLVFMFLDMRNRDLVHRAERVLKKIEAQEIFREEQKETSFKGILLKDEGMEDEFWSERQTWVTHGTLLFYLQFVILILSLLGCIYGFGLSGSSSPPAPDRSLGGAQSQKDSSTVEATGSASNPSPAPKK